MRPDINKMTLRQKIGQTLMVRQSDLLLRADKQYDELRGPEEARNIMKECQFGAIWASGNEDVNFMSQRYNGYFDFTSKKYVDWVKEACADLEIPPILANDICGRVCCKDLSVYPTGLIVGAANSEDLAFELGKCIAVEHQAAGITWIWDPIADLFCRLGDSVNRTFSNIPDQLGRMTTAFMKGMQSVGTAATAKHFPGPDSSTLRDSHVTLDYNSQTLAQWKQTQGAIFQKLINEGIMAIMSNAKMFPAMEDRMINGHMLSTGLSDRVLIDLLKKEMGFEGVIITDDVNMGGYTICYSHDELYGRMIAAGNDMLLGVSIDAVDIVEDCVKRGIVTEERITDACRRVLNMKEKLGLLRDDYQPGNIDVEEAKKKTAEVSHKIAEKGITLIRNEQHFVPLQNKPRKVTIFVFSYDPNTIHDVEAMKIAFEKRGADVIIKNRPKSFDEVKEASDTCDLIIYTAFIGHFAPKGFPGFYGEEFWSLRYAFTEGAAKSIAVSLGNPFTCSLFMNEAETIFNLYSPSPEVQKSFVAVLYGEIDCCGVAPVDMESPVMIKVK